MAVDVAVRGAGPVGCTLALLLHGLGKRVALAGRRPGGTAPGAARPITLSHASRLILERAGAWPALRATPITTIHVSQAGGFGRTLLTAADAGVPALGHVVDYAALAASLAARAAAAGIEISYDAGAALDDAALLVHAEGASGDANEKRYGQDALVALVAAEPRAGSTAYERFTTGGPLALLPLEGRYAVVWGASEERARALCAATDDVFLSALERSFGSRAGRFVAVASRGVFPLALRVRAARVGEREVFVGNAAQTLHPVAGQGLNLGLRDAWELAQAIADAPDPGEATVLGRYAARRRLDAAATIRATDLLAGLFLGANPLARAARGAALTALDVCAPARRFFARRMIYGASALP